MVVASSGDRDLHSEPGRFILPPFPETKGANKTSLEVSRSNALSGELSLIQNSEGDVARDGREVVEPGDPGISFPRGGFHLPDDDQEMIKIGIGQ